MNQTPTIPDVLDIVFARHHMIPEYHEERKIILAETHQGTEVIPCNLLGLPDAPPSDCSDEDHVEWLQTLDDYLPSGVTDPDSLHETVSGYVWRMTAPGYSDCSAWQYASTEEQAFADILTNEHPCPDSEGPDCIAHEDGGIYDAVRNSESFGIGTQDKVTIWRLYESEYIVLSTNSTLDYADAKLVAVDQNTGGLDIKQDVFWQYCHGMVSHQLLSDYELAHVMLFDAMPTLD